MTAFSEVNHYIIIFNPLVQIWSREFWMWESVQNEMLGKHKVHPSFLWLQLFVVCVVLKHKVCLIEWFVTIEKKRALRICISKVSNKIMDLILLYWHTFICVWNIGLFVWVGVGCIVQADEHITKANYWTYHKNKQQ